MWFPALPLDAAPVLLLALLAQAISLALAGVAYVVIWRAAYPSAGHPPATRIVTCAIVGSALNTLLPFGIGTLTMLGLFLALLPNAKPAGIAGGFAVHKAFPALVGVATAAYLAVGITTTIRSRVDVGAGLLLPLGVLAVVLALVAVRWGTPRLRPLLTDLRQGCGVMGSPHRYLGLVVLPQAVGVVAKLATIGLFLRAFDLPVSPYTVLVANGAGMLASLSSFTPNGLGANQGAVAVALADVAAPVRLAAFSFAHQLTMGAWTLGLATLCIVVFLDRRQGFDTVAQALQAARALRRPRYRT